MIPASILPAYELAPAVAEPFGTGLINNTWKVVHRDKQYILQRINDTVFSRPMDIANNIHFIAKHFAQYHPEYKFIAPLTTKNGDEFIDAGDEGFFRLFPFVAGSHS